MLKIRIEDKEDFYGVLCKWWDDWNFPNLTYKRTAKSIFVVSKAETDLYAIPVYVTESSICWIGFPTSNRKASKDLKEGALDYGLLKVCKEMKKQGYDFILTTSDTPKLMKTFKDGGFSESDQGTNYYTKQL